MRIARFPLLLALAVALVGGCGSNTTTYRPDSSEPPTDARSDAESRGGNVVVRFTSRQRFVDGTWRADGRHGRLTILSRRPSGKEGSTYRFALPRPPDGRASVELRSYVPYVERRSITVQTGNREAPSVRVRSRHTGATSHRPAPGGREIFVSAGAPDGGDGSRERPLADLNVAVAQAPPGSVIRLAPGDYPELQDSGKQRTAPVTVTAAEATRPRIAGARIAASNGLHLHRVALTSAVTLGDKGAPAKDVEIVDSELTTATRATCLTLRHGSQDIALVYNHIHDCRGGIAGPGGSEPSSGIEIRGNLIENLALDGIQFVDWSHVNIDRNVIREMYDPAGQNHADAVQAIGGGRDVRITSNELSRSRHQLILISADIHGPMKDVYVANNLLYDAGAFALNGFGVDGMTVVNNTVWKSGGGMILGTGKGNLPRRVTIANNVLSSFYAQKVTSGFTRRMNYEGRSNGAAEGRLAISGLRFTRPEASDYRVLRPSATLRRADRRLMPRADLFGVRRTNVLIGAIG